MTAVSFIVSRGAATGNLSVSANGSQTITVGTVAPNSGDIQFCWNQTDAQGKNVTRKDLKLALKLFERAIQQYGGQVSGQASTGVIGPP